MLNYGAIATHFHCRLPCPSRQHPDYIVLGAIADILSSGRTSRFHKKLIRDEKASISIGAFPGYPGDKYANLFVIYSFPAQGHSNEKNEEMIMAEIENLKTELVTEDELKKVKRNAKAGFIRSLRSNRGLAARCVPANLSGVTGARFSTCWNRLRR